MAKNGLLVSNPPEDSLRAACPEQLPRLDEAIGKSVIAGPDGSLIKVGSKDREEILVADLSS